MSDQYESIQLVDGGPAQAITGEFIVLQDQGPPGRDGSSYVHTQSTPATEWIVNHNLGYNPVTTVFDPGGQEIEAHVLDISVNQLRVYLSPATYGKVRCV